MIRPAPWWIAPALVLGALAAGAAVLVPRREGRSLAADAGAAVGRAAVDVADGVLTGAVETIGAGVGVPVTNQTECEKAIAEGRTWDASFACPAKRFLEYVWG